MPIYEYQCDDCGVRFERLQSMSADPVSICPECSGTVHRVISPVGVIFKGSGFYVTDNRSSSSSAGSRKRESSPESGDTSESSDSSESSSSVAEKSESKTVSKSSD